MEIKNEITMLIHSKREDDYWDFKEQFYENRASLLHDIICMANNRSDRDAYIIFGVQDKTYEVVGVENDKDRKTQQQVIDLLKDQKFVSGIRPRIELHTVIIEKHEIDVLVVKNSTDTPYYLTEQYSYQGKIVRANHIYTRVGDTNTAIDKSADINHVEYLWKKRFLLTRSPFEQVMKRLANKKEWEQDENVYYNIYSPEFTVTISNQEDKLRTRSEFYAYMLTDSSVMYRSLSIKYFGTQIYSDTIVYLDGARYCTPAPKWEHIYFDEYKVNSEHAFKYFTKDSSSYKLNEFLYDTEDHEAAFARKRFFKVVLLFEDNFEKEEFIFYVEQNKDMLIKRLEDHPGEFSSVYDETENQKEVTVSRLKIGEVLNQMLFEFRSIRKFD